MPFFLQLPLLVSFILFLLFLFHLLRFLHLSLFLLLLFHLLFLYLSLFFIFCCSFPSSYFFFLSSTDIYERIMLLTSQVANYPVADVCSHSTSLKECRPDGKNTLSSRNPVCSLKGKSKYEVKISPCCAPLTSSPVKNFRTILGVWETDPQKPSPCSPDNFDQETMWRTVIMSSLILRLLLYYF